MDYPLRQKLNQLFFTRAQQQEFMEDISELVKDGVPAGQANAAIGEIVTGNTKELSDNIATQLAAGRMFADGLEGWFPQSVVEIIRAGEEGGTLAENMVAAARALSQQANALAAFLSATIYPCVVIIMGLVVTVFIRHSVFQNFETIKPISEWPANGRFLVHLADFMQYWWWFIVMVLVAAGFGISAMLSRLTGEPRKMLDSVPLFSLYRDVTSARLMETLGLLLSNGIVLKRALSILLRNATPYIAWHLYVMQFRLSGGRENIAEVLDTGLISKADIIRLRIIAKGRGFEHALTRLGQLSAARNLKNVTLAAQIIGFILLGTGAGLAAFMIFAVYGVGSFVGT